MRDDKTGTDEELNTPDTARTIPTRRRKEPEPPATDEWRPPASLNPGRARSTATACRTNRTWEAAKPKQLSDMLPYPNPASADTADDKPRPTLEGMR